MLSTTPSIMASFVAALLVAHAAAQAGVLPPSPTASVGCSAHGDHWHCDGPAETSDVMSILPTDDLSTISGHDDHPTGTMSILPTDDLSSVASSVSEATGTMTILPTDNLSTVSGHDDHPTATEHADETSTHEHGSEETGGPGCVQHGDHFHCDPADNTTHTNTTGPDVPLGDEDNSAGAVRAGGLAVVLAVAGALLL